MARGTILIADDDAAIRTVLNQALARAGYSPRATGNAATVAEAASTTPPGVPAYEHARALQRRAVWSDLRKSVILGGIGLGLTLFSMLDDGTPNSVGLVLLFVGVGYGLLWHFEGRGRPSNRDTAAPPSGSV